ncbi:PadR family transcriptional regulator [Sutcliffiella horikoshii]|uniref:PadR family transcriptional regulator n=1 Tax=Sutcliffiella horikoshii TaxID=79883 RepID=UPI001CFC6CF3|nr:PadR family transcriptional regulator [Sutcliffiella horikoshii]
MSLKYALLGLLSQHPQTGYEIYKTFKEKMIYFWSSTHSQIYTELNKMEKDELIESEFIYQEGTPNKKMYSITNQGKKMLVEWLVDEAHKPAKIKDEFLIKASAFHLLTKKEILTLLDSIISREKQVLDGTLAWQKEHLENSIGMIGDFATSEYGIMYAKMYIEWCEKVKDEVITRMKD